MERLEVVRRQRPAAVLVELHRQAVEGEGGRADLLPGEVLPGELRRPGRAVPVALQEDVQPGQRMREVHPLLVPADMFLLTPPVDDKCGYGREPYHRHPDHHFSAPVHFSSS